MRGYLDCQSCFLRQALEAARRCTDNEAVQARVIKQVHAILADLDYHLSPPLVAYSVYEAVSEITGCADPYRQEKERSNEIAVGLYSWAREMVENSNSPLDTALRLAAAANVVDFGIGARFDLKESLRSVLTRGLDIDESDTFKDCLSRADSLMYIGDNAGEIVFDKLFLEIIGKYHPSLQKFFVVRGGPVINDVTLNDANGVQMSEVAEILSSGLAAPGLILERCSGDFIKKFRSSDLILAKGQGNYESLGAEHDRRVFFLLRTKCDVVAKHLNVPVGSFIMKGDGGAMEST